MRTAKTHTYSDVCMYVTQSRGVRIVAIITVKAQKPITKKSRVSWPLQAASLEKVMAPGQRWYYFTDIYACA